MGKVLACIDGSVYADSTADHAAWAAGRLDLPVELLQVLGRREATSEDRSGRIVAGARRKLLAELAELDAARAKLLRDAAWLALDETKRRLEAAGAADVAITLRHGDLIDTIEAREADVEMLVIGKRGEAADFATLHLGSNLERVVRASSRPVLVASRAFRPISRVLIAFDGGASALKAVDEVSRSPLYAGLDSVLLTVGEADDARRDALERAAGQLRGAGRTVQTRIESGRPEEVIGRAVGENGAHLLVMGAYGHSRLRAMVIGSTTSALIRACLVPVVVYR